MTVRLNPAELHWQAYPIPNITAVGASRGVHARFAPPGLAPRASTPSLGKYSSANGEAGRTSPMLGRPRRSELHEPTLWEEQRRTGERDVSSRRK